MKPSLLQLFMKKFNAMFVVERAQHPALVDLQQETPAGNTSREHSVMALAVCGRGGGPPPPRPPLAFLGGAGGARPTLSSIGYHGGPGRPPHTRTSCTNGWQFF